jgi:formylglycine-generating enzyme required for sulfatase activity
VVFSLFHQLQFPGQIEELQSQFHDASMRHWFLSFNSQDLALMQGLETSLRRKDPQADIYFAPRTMRAGGFYMPELAKAVNEATAFVLLVGKNGLGPWQVIEYYEALDRRVKAHAQQTKAPDQGGELPEFPVVLVLLEGEPAPGLPFLRQLHWIVTPDPASERSIARLLDAAQGAGSTPGQLWRHTAPYRGLSAMTEADADFFFGRVDKTVEVINTLQAGRDKLPVLIGNSGVGKSSIAQAGVLSCLRRQSWPETANAGAWPAVFRDSRGWCFLTLRPGAEPIKALVEAFLETWRFDAGDPARIKQRNEWVELLLDENKNTDLSDLLDETERRHKELNLSKPPAFFLYIDQGEELYVRAEERQRRRFSEVLAHALGDPRLRAMLSMRADFFGDLQKDESLYAAHRLVSVPPLREMQLREVVNRPAELLAACFETDRLAGEIARRTAEESAKDAGALPLLSYLLDDMWSAMVRRGDGTLRLPPATMEIGGVLVERANSFLALNPRSEDALRGVLALKLATVREDGEPTRRRAFRSEFSEEEWRLVSELADYPNRLLVTATPEGGEAYAEVAHEAIFRRWEKLRNWITAEREFLAWKTGLEAACRAWKNTPDSTKTDALLMGASLTQAQNWRAKRGADLPGIDREFIDQSSKRDSKLRARARRLRAFVYVLLVGIIAGLVGLINQGYLKEQWNWYTIMRPYMLAQVQPYVLSSDAEGALKPRNTFRECAKDCPEMIVVRAGNFIMGSEKNEDGRFEDEGPQHFVAIKPFAASKFAVTFADWDACVSVGECPQVEDGGFGPREKMPVINVSWYQAQKYAEWFSKMTGRPYRLLTEAEWEYAARADKETAYYWGPEIGKGNANCRGCGSGWDGTAPVGSFAPNMFAVEAFEARVRQVNAVQVPRRSGIWCTPVAIVPDLLDPLIDVAMHVVKANGIRGLLPNVMLSAIGIAVIPSMLIELRFIVPERILRLAACTCSVLPLRLGQRAIFLACDPGQPPDVRPGFAPVHLGHRLAVIHEGIPVARTGLGLNADTPFVSGHLRFADREGPRDSYLSLGALGFRSILLGIRRAHYEGAGWDHHHRRTAVLTIPELRSPLCRLLLLNREHGRAH